MPELPDVVVYVQALRRFFEGARLERVRLHSPFVLRSVEVPVTALAGRRVTGFKRMGKRIVMRLEGELFVVIHLMVAGRLHLSARPNPKLGRIDLAAFDFERATLRLTEASKKRRASLHFVAGGANLEAHSRGGLEVIDASAQAFAEVLRRENHTLKRALTDPRLFSGIGNAYSDEILHRARMPPTRLTQRMSDADCALLFDATRHVLTAWIARLRKACGDGFPEKVTAFRPEMSVHGRYRQPCRDCGTPIQRIVYAENETNYCPLCQNGGKLLADRGLSRLLKQDWPRSIDELESLPGKLLR